MKASNTVSRSNNPGAASDCSTEGAHADTLNRPNIQASLQLGQLEEPKVPPAAGQGAQCCQTRGGEHLSSASRLTCRPCAANRPGRIDTAFNSLPGSPDRDAGITHEFHILSAGPTVDPNARTLFLGKILTGPASATYHVEPLPPGTYYFQCDVHPTLMNGAFIVR